MEFPDTIKAEISKDDILWAKRGDAGQCPVARSVSRLVDYKYHVLVTPWDVSLYDHTEKTLECMYRINPEASAAIDRYDYGERFVLTEVTLTKRV